jgi:hypothetical protein
VSINQVKKQTTKLKKAMPFLCLVSLQTNQTYGNAVKCGEFATMRGAKLNKYITRSSFNIYLIVRGGVCKM